MRIISQLACPQGSSVRYIDEARLRSIAGQAAQKKCARQVCDMRSAMQGHTGHLQARAAKKNMRDKFATSGLQCKATWNTCKQVPQKKCAASLRHEICNARPHGNLASRCRKQNRNARRVCDVRSDMQGHAGHLQASVAKKEMRDKFAT